jgi:hypothetical protein
VSYKGSNNHKGVSVLTTKPKRKVVQEQKKKKKKQWFHSGLQKKHRQVEPFEGPHKAVTNGKKT